MSSDYDQWLSFAKQLAQDAGELIVEARKTATFDRNYKLHHELVTSTDIAVDTFICEKIAATFPHHKILSEESFPELDVDSLVDGVPIWVIDPIDGTVNFAHGHHHVAVSIGLFIGSTRILGVVYAPFLAECYSALRGKGAYCNDQKLFVSAASALRNALVATGFPYQKASLPDLIERLSRVLHACQDVRRNGSAALDLCWVAAGRLDAYYETVKPWDMAAGALIAEEAGARLGYFLAPQVAWPEAVNGEGLLVSTPALYDDLKALL
ncbi:inositol monophosphatase family protein [Marinomonas posidonica]|uniref:Inositol-1-monophosphatase n=1 Tax=Marinomonas posidonica (strain CECT 7376 / NCIMB 14433 / IVIA-Po-181) TaxID=491952 RepID=F6D0C5_MARPP|nr:inositol monophosphatase family protein [Marinomonas posidonica]AEF53647.1 inositol monophosphatase [Marinomonas posidonica IVIA-Po-181]